MVIGKRAYNKNDKSANNKSLRVFQEKLLEKTNKIAPETSEQKVMFSITYYPAFQNVINILQEFHLLLAPD